MEEIKGAVVKFQDFINGVCEGQPAWKIIVTTAGSTIGIIWLKDFLFQDESKFVHFL